MFDRLLAAIVDDDLATGGRLIEDRPALVTESIAEDRLYDAKVFHWLYQGDTALHLAAAGHRAHFVKLLLAAGADHRASGRRGATPLHYAADGFVTGAGWEPLRQVETIDVLLRAGADMHATDANGATALHRAVRTRCAAAVRCLLAAGSDVGLRNKSGSTAFHLAVQNTGRGGSGSDVAKVAQRDIIEAFLDHGVSPRIEDAKGKSVLDWATAEPVRQLLERGAARRTTAKR